MNIKFKNNKGLNERKSNQGNMNSPENDIEEQIKEKNLGINEQEKTEEAADDIDQITGKSFYKNIPKIHFPKK